MNNIYEILLPLGTREIYVQANDPLKFESFPFKTFDKSKVDQLRDSIVILYHPLGVPSEFDSPEIKTKIKSNNNILIENCSDVFGMTYKDGKKIGNEADYILYRFDKFSVFTLAERAFGIFGNALPQFPLLNTITQMSLSFGMVFHNRMGYFINKRQENWGYLANEFKSIPNTEVLKGDFSNPLKLFWFKVTGDKKWDCFKNYPIDIAIQDDWVGLPIYPSLIPDQLKKMAEICRKALQ